MLSSLLITCSFILLIEQICGDKLMKKPDSKNLALNTVQL